MLEELFRDDPLTVWHEPDDPVAATVERHASGLQMDIIGEAGHEMLQLHPHDWSSTLDAAPDAKVGRWLMGWQTPLVRGWTGAIIVTERFNSRTGDQDSTLELYAEKLEKGGWKSLDPEATNNLRWEGGGRGIFHRFAADRESYGWQLNTWQLNPQAGSLHAAWLDAAYKGKAVARRQIARHLAVTAVPDKQQESARKFLRDDPDAAEAALLGFASDATEDEKSAADWAGWIRGKIADKPPGMPDSSIMLEASDAWDGRPRFCYMGSGLGMVTVQGADVYWWFRTEESGTEFRKWPFPRRCPCLPVSR